ncbi:organic cation transporter protein-like [Tribolium madens]|uniref:organic cation transporter protein-like n=1 Tax=Tribolium madens TaxID=41895 RepID=UPI001CF74B1A|nr:organic cation transporter protein-like [Tribolium madens]
MTTLDNSLDSILVQIGDFGKYQSFMFSLVCFGVVLHSGVHVAFVFTAMDVDYRCEIPKCDAVDPQFEPPWLSNAIPYSENGPAKCTRYKINATEDFGNCTKRGDFTTLTEKCDSFVYKTREKSILQEYDLQCDDNLWKLTLVGTINNVGQFFGLFISGVISDRFGRKVIFIWGLILCGVCGLLRTLAPTYIWFLVFEFLDAAFGAGSYVCGFIMGVELVGPKKRVLTGTLVSSCYALGEVFAAGSAWYFEDWRPIIYILYGPPMLLFVYFWIIPESIRWNLSKGRIEEAKDTLRRVAKVNGKPISEDALDKLAMVDPLDSTPKSSICEVLKSPVLVLRLINCFFCWITCAFLFYGLTLNSVALAGNGYLDFILTSLVEIPAYFACNYVVEKMGRKWSLSLSFFMTGISCCVFIFIPKDLHNVSLAMWMLGKFGATAAFTIIYIITSELFPTPLRHSLMGACSTFGRIGSMIAPQTPLLAQIWEPLPIIMFTAMATIAGLLTLLFPETVNIKLPDTIDEAISIGKSKNNVPKD